MRRRTLKALAVGAISVSTLPTVVVLLATRADAAPTVLFGQFSVTAIARATATGGNIGASGGLTPLDSGSASVDASLDNSPTAMALARPVEPGTTFTTVASQVPPDVPVPPVPQALAAYPGTTSTSTVSPVPGTTATATVTATSATGRAQSAGGEGGVATLGTTTASSTLTATGGGSAVTALADSFASGLDVSGVLTVKGVRGHAEIRVAAGGKRTVGATTAVSSITVAGQAVEIDDTGVHAVGTTVPLGPSLAQLSAAANSVLSAAGISLALADPIHTTTTTPLGSHATADSGGLQVTIKTAEVGSATVPANTAIVTLGRVVLTESDAPSVDEGTPFVPGDPGVSPPGGSTGVPGTAGIPGSPGQTVTIGGVPGAQAPTLAGAPPTIAPARFLSVAGHRISGPAAIAALGGWQALTLGSATFALLALRRPELEEEHLCPCPL
jgi:hypothetical protein